MMSIHELFYKVEERSKNGESINDLKEEIRNALKMLAEMPSPAYYFAHWTRWLGSNSAIAESEIKYMDVTAEQFETLALVARKLGKTKPMK